MGIVKPTCLALVLCKSVTRPVRGGDATVKGAFEFFEAETLPIPAQPFTVWMQFRNGNGHVVMELVVEYVPPGRLDPEEIVAVKFSVDFTDPNAMVEHEAVFDNGLPLAREGRYRLKLAANGIPIMERFFGVYRSAQ